MNKKSNQCSRIRTSFRPPPVFRSSSKSAAPLKRQTSRSAASRRSPLGVRPGPTRSRLPRGPRACRRRALGRARAPRAHGPTSFCSYPA
uniref:Uncharacterized protein n=1 Tax=Arundo donax TaxID=35708 RepID=A0A0A9DIN7_ARUDO